MAIRVGRPGPKISADAIGRVWGIVRSWAMLGYAGAAEGRRQAAKKLGLPLGQVQHVMEYHHLIDPIKRGVVHRR